jgi:hypothetical protein
MIARVIITAVLAMMTLFGASGAKAGILSGTFDVTVWNGSPFFNYLSSDTANAQNTPTGPSLAHFTYTGALDWRVDESPSNNPHKNVFGSFLDAADISNFTSSFSGTTAQQLDHFLNTSMSVANDRFVTFFEITTTLFLTGSSSGTVTHDDGASLYDDGVALFSSPYETSAMTDHFNLHSGANSLALYYVEANGAPSVLSVSVCDPVNVPEPSAAGLCGLALIGLGWLARRQRKRAA